MDNDKAILFAWGEAATFGGAIAALAHELEPQTRTVLNKQDREALARTMLRSSEGRADVGPCVVSWGHADRPEGLSGLGDLLYSVE
jgi:hypothetical protein